MDTPTIAAPAARMSSIPKRLTPGQALVLSGPQGCGKSTVAQAIAAEHGTHTQVSDLQVLNELNDVLQAQPSTVIVVCEGQLTRQLLSRLQDLVTSPTTRVRQPFESAAREVPTPNFIFCTQDATPFQGNARFYVVPLHAGGLART